MTIKNASMSRISMLGSVMQLAFVPINLPAALNYWIKTMGVGPFFKIPHAQTMADQIEFRGTACEADFTIYLSYWGDLQIELFEQHNNAPSPFKEWLDYDREGLHHTCIEVDDLAAARDVAIANGAEAIFSVDSSALNLIYLDTKNGSGSILELSQPTQPVRDYYAHMKQCVKAWDGIASICIFGE